MHHFVCSLLCLSVLLNDYKCVCVSVHNAQTIGNFNVVCIILGYHALLLLAERINECSIISDISFHIRLHQAWFNKW